MLKRAFSRATNSRRARFEQIVEGKATNNLFKNEYIELLKLIQVQRGVPESMLS
jgi:hypothetical protein